jgi:hypothetical protein
MARNGFPTPGDLLAILYLSTLAVTAAVVLGVLGVIDGNATTALITAGTIGPLTYITGHRRGYETVNGKPSDSPTGPPVPSMIRVHTPAPPAAPRRPVPRNE